VLQAFKGRVLAVADAGFIPYDTTRHIAQIVKIFVLINKMMEKM